MFLKNSKVLSLMVSTSLLFGILGSANAANVSKDLEITDVSRFDDAVEVTWSGDYQEYEVYTGGEMVYKGTDKKFKYNKLTPDTFVDFLVVALDENSERLDQAKVDTYTLAKGESKKNASAKEANKKAASPLDSLRVTTIYNKDAFKFDWEDISGINEYEVYKNKKKIGKIKKSEYNKKGLTEGDYEFIGKKEVNDKQKKKIREEAEEKLKRELTREEEQFLFYENYSIIKSFQPVIDEGKTIDTNAALANPAYSINLKYMTFIPSQYVDNPYYPSADPIIKYFGGNWRNYNPSSYEYKTRTETQYIFSNKSLNFSKSVPSSKFYDADKNLKYTKTASDSGIYLSEKGRSATQASFVVYHNADIPYYEATTPEIDYNYTADLKSENGGKIVIYGSHDKAPSHEFYYQINGGSYRTIFQHDIVDFKYLFGVYPSWSFNFSN
jgi:hypothetical protein